MALRLGAMATSAAEWAANPPRRKPSGFGCRTCAMPNVMAALSDMLDVWEKAGSVPSTVAVNDLRAWLEEHERYPFSDAALRRHLAKCEPRWAALR